ncbi:hypothetical protein [Gallibacterium anatis]
MFQFTVAREATVEQVKSVLPENMFQFTVARKATVHLLVIQQWSI